MRLVTAIVLFMLFGGPLHAQSPEVNFDPGELSESSRNELLGFKQLSAIPASIQGSKSMSQPWLGSMPSLDAKVNRFVLGLAGNLEDGKSTELEIDLTFEDQAIVLRRNSPEDKRTIGGVRFDLRQAPWAKFIRGDKSPHLYVYVPKATNSSRIGIVLCPRWTVPVEGQSLREEDDELVLTIKSEQYFVEGSSRAEISSSTGIARTAAVLLTTPNVATAVTPIDDWFARYPLVAVQYYPRKDFSQPALISDRQTRAGIRARALLHNSAGYLAIHENTSSLWIEQHNLTNLPEMPGVGDNKFVRNGSCFLVLRENQQEKEYSKEQLILPENLRALDLESRLD